MQRKCQGFTLVEVMIVVVVMSILAMIVLPRYSSASDEARESGLCTDLHALTSQIHLYRVEHGGRGPHINASGVAEVSSANFIQRLTSKTDATGKVTAEGKYGPYLLEWPTNPFSGDGVSRTIKFGVADPAPRDGTTGWYYNTETCAISPNSTTGGETYRAG